MTTYANVDLLAQVFTNAGVVGNGMKIATYAGGTSTPLATKTDAVGNVSNTNPIVADSAGRYEAWIARGVAYKFELQTSAGVVIDTVDNFLIQDSTANTPTVSFLLDFFYEGDDPPVSVALLGGHKFAAAVTFPANFSGAVGHCLVVPTGSFVIDLKKNGSACGTVTISTGGTFTFASSAGAAVSFAIADRLTAHGPTSVDATANQFFWTMIGSFT